MSTEFDAALALAEWERDKADWVKSMGNASKLAAKYQGERDEALAEVARLRHLIVQADSICSLIFYREKRGLGKQTLIDLDRLVTSLRKATS